MFRSLYSFLIEVPWLNKSRLDGALLLITSVIKKVIGIIREAIIVYIFGASSALAAYLFLRTVSGSIGTFIGPSALQANIVPKFTKIFKNNLADDVDLNLARANSFKIAFKVSVVLFFLTATASIYTAQIYSVALSYLLFISLAISITGGILFDAIVGLMIQQSKGNYVKYSAAGLVNYFLSAFLIYPLSFMGVIGIELSRALGCISQNRIGWSALIDKKRNASSKVSPTLELADFNVYKLFSNNFPIFILLCSRGLLGLQGKVEIVHFFYASLILNAFLTTFIFSFNAISIKNISERQSFDFKKIIFFALGIACLVVGVSYIGGKQIISILFERGEFTSVDTLKTFGILKEIALPFALHYMAIIFFQPVLAIENKFTENGFKTLFVSFVTITIGFYLFLMFSPTSSISYVFNYIYAVSITTLLIACFFFLGLSRR